MVVIFMKISVCYVHKFHFRLSNGQIVISPQVRMSCPSELRTEIQIRRLVF